MAHRCSEATPKMPNRIFIWFISAPLRYARAAPIEKGIRLAPRKSALEALNKDMKLFFKFSLLVNLALSRSLIVKNKNLQDLILKLPRVCQAVSWYYNYNASRCGSFFIEIGCVGAVTVYGGRFLQVF